MKVGKSRTYVVPLRKAFLKAPKWRRSKKAMTTLREFLAKHTKADRVVIGRWLNEEIWKHGGKNPPSKVKVKVELKEEEVEKEGLAKNEKIAAAHAELSPLPARASRAKKREKKKDSIRERIKKRFAGEAEEESETEEAKKDKKEQDKKAKMTKEQELKAHK